MDEGLISRRYAKALLRYAQEQGCADRIYDESKNFEIAFTQNPGVEKALQNPVLESEEKEHLIVSATGGNPANAFLRFIRLVIKNRRELYIRSICLMYQKLYRQAYNIAQVKIITAAKLSDNIINRIKQLMQQKSDQTIEFVHEIKPSIIGGFILQCDSKQLDASVSNELKLLRLKLLNNR